MSKKEKDPRHLWGQNRRMAFIDFRLMWEGQINRSDIMEFFGISAPQASADLQSYLERQGDTVRYDTSKRKYLATKSFEPLLVKGTSESYLSELLALHSGFLDSEASFIGKVPSLFAVPMPTRTVDSKYLRSLLRCIREQQSIEIHYRSMNRPEGAWRTVSPHALAWDGMRWHVRAYGHDRQEFRDYVLGRITETGKVSNSAIEPADDAEWSTMVKVVIGPHSQLKESQKELIEFDYGMRNGELELQVKQSMLMYVFQRLGLYGSGWKAKEAVINQIEIKNYEEIKPLLSNPVEW